MPDPIKAKSKYIDAPVTKRIFTNQPVGNKGINVLDSQYDEYITPSNVDSINLSRAKAQPWYDQLGNNTAKLIPAIGLGIVENAGYIGELFDPSQDYTNALTEWATKGRQKLDELAPNYRQNPNAFFDLGDSGWWAENGMSLVESIGEFFVTGAAVGGAAGSVAKGIANVVKAGKYLEGGLQAAAQLGTASTLAYTEGAMSGARIYKQVYDHEIELHGNIEAAKEKAADAASKTVRLNTVINTGLNITSVSPLFKTMGFMQTAKRLGLNKQAGEKLADWGLRLGQLEAAGIPHSPHLNKLLLEAGQEALEEDVNVYAEHEGRIKGGIEKASSKDPFQRFLNNVFTQEGALNAVLGAIGGVGQTIAMEHTPFKRDPNTGKLISTSALENLERNEVAKGLIQDLREDINYITTKQNDLNTALEKNDTEGVLKAKEDLFNIGALRAIRNGTGEEFADEIRKIGLIDNSQVGEDGKTEAMRRGYADSQNDNEYKETAIKKSNDIIQLGKEYENLTRLYPDKFVADQVFRERLNIYSTQETVDKLEKENTTLTSETLKLVTDPTIASVVNESAEISGVNILINALEEKTNLSNTEKKMLGNLKNTNMINSKLMSDAIQLDPSLKAKLNENVGKVNLLANNRVPLIAFKEELKQLKGDYDNLLSNNKETNKAFTELKNTITDDLKKKETEKKVTEEKTKEEADKQDTKIKKEAKKAQYREVVGDFTIVSNPKGGFDIVDEEAGAVLDTKPDLEIARATAQEYNKKAKEQTVKEKIEPLPVIVQQKSNQPDLTVQVKTKDTTDKEEQLEKEAIQSNTINETKAGRANKIAYRAVEEEKGIHVNQAYLHLHSSKFGVGTKVILRVAKEVSFYKADMPNNKVPIGIYHNGIFSGFVHTLGDNEENIELQQIRDYVVTNGEAETTIIDKDLGILHKGAKASTAENLRQVKSFVVSRDDGKIYSGIDKTYSSEKLIPNKLFGAKQTHGRTFAIVDTPNGKEFGIILDTKRLTPEVVKSLMIATRIFLNTELSKAENELLAEIFDKFDIDVRTPDGYRKYFKTFLYDYQLTDPKDIEEKILDKNDKRWVNFSGNGVRFLRSGGQVFEVGRNTPEDVQDGLLTQLESHLSKMFFNVDLEALQDNAKVKVPIFGVDNKQSLTYSEYNKGTYSDHIASTTETDVVQFQVGDNEYSAFVSPKIYFNTTSFLSSSQEENYGKAPKKKSTKKAILSAEKQTEEKPKKKFKSMTKRLVENKIDEQQVTDDNVDERITLCE